MPINKEFALNDNISESFTNLLATLSGFRSQVTEIQNSVRLLEKQVTKEIKQQEKKINKNKLISNSQSFIFVIFYIINKKVCNTCLSTCPLYHRFFTPLHPLLKLVYHVFFYILVL